MKRIIAFLIASLMIISMVTAQSLDGEKIAEAPEGNNIAMQDGEIIGKEAYEPSLWYRIFSGQAFSFVDVRSEDVIAGQFSCQLQSTHGTYIKRLDRDIKMGAQCDIGEYIVFESQGGDIGEGYLLFSQVWQRNSEDDLPNTKNYYLDELEYYYSYDCYDCNIDQADDFEPGCLTADGSDCVSQDDDRCWRWYEYESVCLDYIGETQKECSTGESKCEGKELYTCDDQDQWKNRGIIKGECGVECLTGDTKCEGSDYFTCQDNKYDNQGVIINRCDVECREGDTKCEDNNYYVCENKKWANQGVIEGKCEVECLTGDTKCEGFEKYTCKNNEYVNNGVVAGECGTECEPMANQCTFLATDESWLACDGKTIINQTELPNCKEDYTCGLEKATIEEVRECKHGCNEGKCTLPYTPAEGNNTLWWIIGGVFLLMVGISTYIGFRGAKK